MQSRAVALQEIQLLEGDDEVEERREKRNDQTWPTERAHSQLKVKGGRPSGPIGAGRARNVIKRRAKVRNVVLGLVCCELLGGWVCVSGCEPVVCLRGGVARYSWYS